MPSEAARSLVPVVRRMQLAQLCSATDELAPCSFALNVEKSGSSILHVLLHHGLLHVSCALTRPLISLRFAKSSTKILCSYP